MNRIRSIKQKGAFWLGIIGAVGVIIFSQWLSMASLGEPILEHWFPNYEFHPAVNFGVSLAIFLAFFWVVFKNRQAFMAVRSFRYHPCKPHQCLVMLLTLPNIIPPKTPLPWPLKTTNKKTGKVIECELPGKELTKEEIEPLNDLEWNWQQILRALYPHRDSLVEVHLIGSPDKDNKPGTGSQAFAQDAERLIKTYRPKVEVITQPQAVDFEDFNAVVSVIGDTLEELKKKYSEDDIIIDITGGQKTASIAAATVTLNSQMHFQYVKTVPYGSVKLEEDVMSYDVRIYSPLSGEG